MKKKLIIVGLAVGMMFTIAACGNDSNQQNTNSQQNTQQQTQQDTNTQDNANAPKISKDKATEIVLQQKGGLTKEEIQSLEQEFDDGQWEYEGKIKHDGKVYEFKINGDTGQVLEFEVDD